MNDELRPSERDAFEALPREHAAPRALEERVVGALRREGLVRAPRAERAPWWTWRLSFAPALAAGLLLFAGGVFVGARVAPTLGPQAHEAGPAAAADLEASGDAYLDALSAYSRSDDSSQAGGRDVARRSASRFLRLAAQEMARLDPDDPLAAAVLNSGPLASAEPRGVDAANAEATHIVWY
jgi:hypothetical protein